MSNFKELDTLPIENFLFDFEELLQKKLISWHPVIKNQICVTTAKEHIDDCHYGCGSFYYDWSTLKIDEKGNMSGDKLKIPKKEEDFTELCSAFKDTSFEFLFTELKKYYNFGRIRIMNLSPKTCLTWHYDESPRLHCPIKTHKGCFMVFEDEVKHLEENKWYYVDTTKYHSVFNGSMQNRIHIVVSTIL